MYAVAMRCFDLCATHCVVDVLNGSPIVFQWYESERRGSGLTMERGW